MKTSDLKNYLNLVSKLELKSTPLVVLTYLYHSNNKFVATDLESKIEFETGFGDLEFFIEIKTLKNLISSIDLKSEISIDAKQIFVNNVPVMNYNQDFTKQDLIDEREKLNCKKYRFLIQPNKIFSVSKFVGNDDLRPLLQCVLYDQEHYVATDAHTMLYEKTTPTSSPEMGEICFNKKTVSLLPKADSMWIEYQTFQCNLDGTLLDYAEFIFENNGFKITSQTTIGDYPRWKNVIPVERNNDEEHKAFCQENNLKYSTFNERYPFQANYTVNKKAFLAALKLSLASANKDSTLIAFTFKENCVILESEDIDMNKKSSITVHVGYRHFYKVNTENKTEIKIGFNGKYLLKCINAVDDVIVKFNIKKENNAVLINDNMLLMPAML